MMKKMLHRILSAFLLLSVLASLPACSKNTLCSVEADGRIFEALGGSRVNRLRVTENGKVIWKDSVRTDKTVGARNGSYGLEILDLNFDGHADIKLVSSVNGDMLSNLCYLYEPSLNSYQFNQGLSELCTVMPQAEQQVILSFTHTKKTYEAAEDAAASYITCDTTTAYYWKNGNLMPFRRVSVTYNSTYNNYVLSVSDYSEEIFEFLDPDDTWFTAEEYQATDLSFLYYFK